MVVLPGQDGPPDRVEHGPGTHRARPGAQRRPAAASAAAAQVDKWKETVARWESEPDTGEGRKELSARAKAEAEKRDLAFAKYHHYEVSSAAFQIAIVLASSAVITGAMVLAWIAIGLGVAGIAFAGIGLFVPHAGAPVLTRQRPAAAHHVRRAPGRTAAVIGTYGYAIVALLIALESMGLPLPGEGALITASVYAGATQRLSLGLIVLAAIAGAVIGDNLGFWLGRRIGSRLLIRYGPLVGITAGRIKLGQYLFALHGGKVVFLGRFVAVLRALAAFLAGVNRMPWSRFFVFNVAGGIVWATLFGVGAYALGHRIHAVAGPVGLTALGLALAGCVWLFRFVRRNEARLEAEAERAIPGPLGEDR